MKTIQIKAKDFFDFLKLRDASMWDIFAQMIEEEEKDIVFVDENGQPLFNYILPKTIEKLKEDQKIFAKEYAEKIAQNN